MQALSGSLFVTLALISSAFLPPASIGREESEERVRRVASGLSELGYELDLEALAVETSSARRSQNDLLALRELYLSPTHDRQLPDLLGALGDWNAGSVEKIAGREAKELGRKLLAFYQPERRALVMFTSKDTAVGKLNRTDFVLAHELVRAWRDTNSDLRGSFARRGGTQEESWILRCALEGEARLAAIAADLRAMGGALDAYELNDLDDPMVQAHPEEHLSLACTHGTRLALHRWQAGGWDGVRAMWDETPDSTEQILHLNKLGEDLPTAIVPPGWPGGEPSAELVSEDRFGELGMLALFERLRVEPDEARAAAAGWDGDLFQLYRTVEGEPALFWRTVWDRDVDAEQFAAVLEANGDGELRVRGRVVDWARTVEGPLAARWLDAASRAEQPLPEGDAGASTTAAVEAEWERQRELGDYVTEGRWVIPDGDFSLPVPERWKAREFRGVRRLVPKLRKHAGSSIAVTPLPDADLDLLLEHYRGELESLGFTVEAAESRELDGRAAGWIRARGTLGQERRAIAVLLPCGERWMALTADVPEASWAELEPVIEETVEGVRFGVEAYPRPSPVDAVATEPELEDGFWVELTELRGEKRFPNVDVWMAEHATIRSPFAGEEDPLPLEENVHRIGHRYRTDSRGRVWIPGGQAQYPWICARTEDRFGYQTVYSSRDGKVSLPLTTDDDLVVEVVNEAGEPVVDVPVGFAVGSSKSEVFMVIQERASAGPRGEALFPHVFGEVHAIHGNLVRDYELFITFAMPMKDRPLVHLPLDRPVEQPVRLVLPPTGSLLVQVEIPEEELQAEDSDFPHGRPGLVWIRDVGDEHTLKFHQIDTAADREFQGDPFKIFFPHVGLGLELDVAVSHRRLGAKFRGPERAGQRVEVTTSPGEKKPEPEYTRDFGVVFTGRCLDPDGQPLAERSFRWTLSYRLSSSSHGSRDLDFQTDEEGYFEFTDHGGGDEGTAHVAVIQALPKPELALEFLFDPWEPLAEGEYPLGDLTFHPSPVVVAGHVVDSDGAPIAAAFCVVDGLGVPDPGSSWKWSSSDITEADGSFLIRGGLQGGAKTLRVRAAGYRDRRQIPFTAGKRVLRVQLEAIAGVAKITGEFLIEGLDRESDSPWWNGAPEVHVEQIDSQEAEVGEVSYSSGGGRLGFEISNLEPGTYRVLVDPSGAIRRRPGAPAGWPVLPAPEPLVPPLKVFLDPGSTVDLGPIDLREKLHGIVITLAGEEGEPVDAMVTQSTSVEGPGSFSIQRFEHHTSEGKLGIIVDQEGADLVISSPDHRRVILKGAREDTKIAMLPPMGVTLVLDEPVFLPGPDYKLYAQLVPARASEEIVPLHLRREKTERLEFSGTQLDFQIFEPGVWRVAWAIGRVKDGEEKLQRDLRGGDSPLLAVVEASEPQIFGIPQPSSKTLDRLIRMLER